MREQIRAYVDNAFAGVKQTNTVQELKEEILSDMFEQYADELADGKTEQEAYNAVIKGAGDLSALAANMEEHPFSHRSGSVVKTQDFNGELHAIVCDWSYGDVSLHFGADTIRVTQTGSKYVSSRCAFRATLAGGKLRIKSPSLHVSLFFWNLPSHLDIYLPDSVQLGDLEINTISGHISAPQVHTNQLTLHAVSGKIDWEGSANAANLATTSGRIYCRAQAAKVEMRSTSGGLQFTGTTQTIRAENVSSGIDLVCQGSAPQTIRAKSISGRIHAMLPENDGFTLNWNSVSGKLNNTFPCVQNHGQAVYKNGAASYSFQTVSGNMELACLTNA